MVKKMCLTALICCLILSSTGAAFAAKGTANEELLRARELGKSVNAFAFDLYKEIAKEEKGNIFFSPLSISMALALAYEGAAGGTREEMRRVLHFKGDVGEQFRAYLNILNDTPKESGELLLATAIWPDTTLKLRPAYIHNMKKQYLSDINPLRFMLSQDASSKINTWTDKHTKGKIKTIVSPTDIENSVLVLTNATYFKCEWQDKFNKRFTIENDFFTLSNTTRKISFMNKSGIMAYFEDDTIQCLRLPYRNNNYSLMIILPKEKILNESVKNIINLDRFLVILSQLKNEKVNLYVPKFCEKKKYPKVTGYLTNLGMKFSFGQLADFHTIAEPPQYGRLYIQNIIHKSTFAINEEFTEASAATAVVGTFSAPSLDLDSYITFIANHPFLYLILDNNDMILFIGCFGE